MNNHPNILQDIDPFEACMKSYWKKTDKQSDQQIRPKRSDYPKKGLRANV